MHFLLERERCAAVCLCAESSLCRIQGCVLMDLCNMSIMSMLSLDFCSVEYVQKKKKKNLLYPLSCEP